jgi:hypothetical protein
MCASPTQILVDVYSDVACSMGAEVALVAADSPVAVTLKAPVTTSHGCDTTSHHVGTAVLQPSGPNDGEIAFAVVTRNDEGTPDNCAQSPTPSGCIVARRQLRFAAHATLHVRVDLHVSCLTTVCPIDQTCIGLEVCASAAVSGDCKNECDESSLVPVDAGEDGSVANADAGGDATSDAPTAADAPREVAVDAPPDRLIEAGADAHGDAVPPTWSILAIAMGDRNACATLPDGVYCWGSNADDALGQPSLFGNALSPILVTSASGTIAHGAQLALGNLFGLASDGTKESVWGKNDLFQLGTGPKGDIAVEVIGQLTYHLAAGGAHACSIHPDKTLYCWGDNSKGQGTSTSTPLMAPTLVRELVDVDALAAGTEHTCAVTGGKAYCWGANDNDQCPGCSGNVGDVPHLITGLQAGVLDLAAGVAISCALEKMGIVECWGSAVAPKGAFTTEWSVASDPPERIAAGGGHACIVTISGALWCWGANEIGQLGIGDTAPHSAAVNVFPRGVTQVAAGYASTCAVVDGALYCWGDNSVGQLGTGDTKSVFSPAMVAIPRPLP